MEDGLRAVGKMSGINICLLMRMEKPGQQNFSEELD
jgi:hypothetical protein